MLKQLRIEDTLRRETVDPVAGQGAAHVVDMADGAEVFEHDPDTPRVIASLTKLFTIGAALENLRGGAALPPPDGYPTWGSILAKAGHDSDNQAADVVTELAGGPESIQKYAHKCGADITIVNGSGKSIKNQCTPAAITTFLVAAYQATHRSEFIQALPLAGVEGTLRLRMRNTLASETVRAKTGTLNLNKVPVQDGLAGYVFGRSRTVAFCIIREHTESRFASRSSIDRMVDALAHYCD